MPLDILSLSWTDYITAKYWAVCIVSWLESIQNSLAVESLKIYVSSRGVGLILSGDPIDEINKYLSEKLIAKVGPLAGTDI